jgi:hypothetical protein
MLLSWLTRKGFAREEEKGVTNSVWNPTTIIGTKALIFEGKLFMSLFS